MGLLDSLFDNLRKVEGKAKNRINFKNELNGFNKSLDSLYFQLNSLNNAIGDEYRKLEDFYYVLVNDYPGKYYKEKSRYIDLIPLIYKHDSKIIKVDTDISLFSYDDIIENPFNYRSSDFFKYDDVLEIISSYYHKAEKYKLFYRQLNEIKKNLSAIQEQFYYNSILKNLLSFEGDYYIDEKKREELLEQVEPIKDCVSKTGKMYYDLNDIYNIKSRIESHNKLYIKEHLNDSIFNSINGLSLDDEQRKSVLKDERSALTIAGAGSGKTLTICGKVMYLLEHDKVSPEDILLLSYSRESASDLNKKLSKINDKLIVGTFHKLGLEILKDVNGRVLNVENQYDAIIEQYFREEMKNRPQIMGKILNYFALYLTPNKRNKKYFTKGDLYEDLKVIDLKSLKSLLLELSNNTDKRETIKKELVKSYEEMAIANFYFINGIEYVYEAPYCVDLSSKEKKQYTPDFFLKKYNIYHEHYGIDKDGIPHQFGGEEAKKYTDSISWKRNIHLQNNTICIETYSYEFDDDMVFGKLEKELKARGVEFKPLSPGEILNALNSIYEDQSFKSFINFVKSFLNLYKARYRDISHFKDFKKAYFRNIYEKKRANLFIDIVQDIYSYYIDYLRKENKIDFDDMILKSMDELDKTDAFKFKNIIVDEFQDISYSRMQFLKKLIAKGNSKLFAVGDDWQAIYRFSGCDLDIFLNFEKYFGKSAINYITSTHRNSQELQDIAVSFITKNSEQYKKTIKSKKHLDKPIKVSFYNNDKYHALIQVLRVIHKMNPHASILVLGRNNHDIDDYLNTELYFDRTKEEKKLRSLTFTPLNTLKLSYCTVHSSKGLEDDYVIVLNADNSKLGFPNKMEDDELLNLVLGAESNYEYAEERRLWYVALTRTKSYTFIIANKNNPSIFLNEIISSCEIINTGEEEKELSSIECPDCKKGRLVMKVNGTKKSKFYGCSNFPYCKYTINDLKAVERNKRCLKCGDFLVYRKGKHGAFFSCNSYPSCKYTEDYIKQ